MESITRYKLIIEYDGSNYCGFQKQPDQINKSIEEILENAIFAFSKERVKIFASGRTDAGVHALGQVVHFDLKKKFENFKILMAINRHLLNENIAVLSCHTVDENFHSRFDAKRRHYRYIINNRRAPLTLQKNRAWHIPQKLDLEAMKLSASYLIGSHDFSSFRDAKCAAISALRTIDDIKITNLESEIYIEISAKSFLHHMVRNILGTLMWVGSGKIKAEEIKNILNSKDRTKSGPNAPAYGLYFLRVDYHANYHK